MGGQGGASHDSRPFEFDSRGIKGIKGGRRNRGVCRVEGDRIAAWILFPRFILRFERAEDVKGCVERYIGEKGREGCSLVRREGSRARCLMFYACVYIRVQLETGKGALHPTAVIFITLLATATSTLLSVKWLLNESLWNEHPSPSSFSNLAGSFRGFIWLEVFSIVVIRGSSISLLVGGAPKYMNYFLYIKIIRIVLEDIRVSFRVGKYNFMKEECGTIYAILRSLSCGTLRRVKSEEVWNLHAYNGRRRDALISHQEIKGEIRADPLSRNWFCHFAARSHYRAAVEPRANRRFTLVLNAKPITESGRRRRNVIPSTIETPDYHRVSLFLCR